MKGSQGLVNAGLVWLLCCGIALGAHSQELSQSSAPTVQDETAGPYVAKYWQTQFLKWLATDKDAVEAWGLFNGGGFTGSGQFGQIMVIGNQQQARVYFVAVAKKEAVTHVVTSPGQLLGFLSSVKTLSEGLGDHWENGLDLFEREFVHLVKEGKTLSVKQRVKWRFGRGKCLQHCALEKIFEKLAK